MSFRILSVLLLLSGVGSIATVGKAGLQSGEASSNLEFSYNIESFNVELKRLDEVLQKKPSMEGLASLRDSLPNAWKISTTERTYSISTEPLRNQLTSQSSEKAQKWVENLISEVQVSSPKTAENLSETRAELDKILKRKEFAAVRPPSEWELLRARIGAWIGRQLLKLFSGIDRHPVAGRLFFWLILISTVILIAFWVFRFVSSRDRIASLPAGEVLVTYRTWQEWIRHAREAASGGNFREAVHSAYWAGIVRLEDSGVVPKDRSKTPREYLRMVVEPAPGELSSRATYKEALSKLTARLERIWYANGRAIPEDFVESLHQLEALGCQLE